MRQVAVFDRLVVVAPISREVSEAFADFVREHATSLFGTAFLLCADGDAAEELVQETLLRAWQKWATFDPQRGTPRGWWSQ